MTVGVNDASSMTTPSTVLVGGDATVVAVPDVVGEACVVGTVSADDVDGTVLGALGGAVTSAAVARGVVVGSGGLVDVPGAATMRSS